MMSNPYANLDKVESKVLGDRKKTDVGFGAFFGIVVAFQLVLGSAILFSSSSWDAVVQAQCTCMQILNDNDNYPCPDTMTDNIGYLISENSTVFALSIVAALFVALGWILWLRQCSHCVVWTCAFVRPSISLVLTAYMFLYHEDFGDSAWFGLLSTAIFAFLVYRYRKEITLSGRIIKEATKALIENPGIIAGSFFLAIVMMAYSVFIFWVLMFGFTIGHAEPSPDFGATTCDYVQDSWASASTTIIGLTFLWTLMYLEMANLYTVATGVSYWYFKATSLDTPKHPTLKGLKRAFSTSAGTISIAALVVALAEAFQSVARSQRRSCVGICIAIVATIVKRCLKFISKFAVVIAAITGSTFMGSARSSKNILERCFVGGFVSETVTISVMSGAAWILSVVIGIIAWQSLGGGFTTDDSVVNIPTDNPDDASASLVLQILAGLLAIICSIYRYFGLFILIMWPVVFTFTMGAPFTMGLFIAILSFFILDFLGHAVLYATNTIFVCYAIDRMNGNTSSHTDEIDRVACDMNGYIQIPDAERGGNPYIPPPQQQQQQQQQWQQQQQQQPSTKASCSQCSGVFAVGNNPPGTVVGCPHCHAHVRI